MHSNNAGAFKRKDLKQLSKTGKIDSNTPCSVCIEQRECSVTSVAERTERHEELARYRKVA